MELEELQQHWQQLDDKINVTIKLQTKLLHLTASQRTHCRLRQWAFYQALDIVFCLTVAFFSGSFLAGHWKSWSLAGPAIIVLFAAILLLIDIIRQLQWVSRIEWSGAVVEIQQSLSRLRLAKVRQFKWIILLSPLVGFCGLMIGLQWLLERQPEPRFKLESLNSWWVASNYIFGVLFIPFGYSLIGYLANRFGNQSWWQTALDNVSGYTMKQTNEELNRWLRLVNESCDG